MNWEPSQLARGNYNVCLTHGTDIANMKHIYNVTWCRYTQPIQFFKKLIDHEHEHEHGHKNEHEH